MKTQLIPCQVNQTQHPKPEQRNGRQRGRRILRSATLWLSFFLIALLAVPVCLLTIPIAAVWSLTDKILKKLEP